MREKKGNPKAPSENAVSQNAASENAGARSRVVPFVAITLVMIIWGLSFLSIKVTVAVLQPMSLALSRFVIASIILFIILRLREPSATLARRDMPRFAVSGIIGITLYFFFENNGVKMTTASTASIIVATIPILTIIADWLFCGNRITLAKALGVVISFAGVYLIVRETGQLAVNSRYFIGNLMMFGAVLSWVVYSLVTRPLGARYSQLAITAYQTLFGTLAIVPFVFFEKNVWHLIDGVVISNVVFLGILCSALGYYLYVYALSALGVGVSSLFINLIPVVTVASSFFILGEKITPTQMAGGSIVIIAVYLADLQSLSGFFGMFGKKKEEPLDL